MGVQTACATVCVLESGHAGCGHGFGSAQLGCFMAGQPLWIRRLDPGYRFGPGSLAAASDLLLLCEINTMGLD